MVVSNMLLCSVCSDSKMDDSIDFHRSCKCGDPVNATFVVTVLLMLVPALLNRVVNSGPLHPPLIDDEVR